MKSYGTGRKEERPGDPVFFENKTVLKAKVTQVLTGGLSVVVDDTRVFIPASLVSDVYEKNLEKYADQEV